MYTAITVAKFKALLLYHWDALMVSKSKHSKHTQLSINLLVWAQDGTLGNLSFASSPGHLRVVGFFKGGDSQAEVAVNAAKHIEAFLSKYSVDDEVDKLVIELPRYLRAQTCA